MAQKPQDEWVDADGEWEDVPAANGGASVGSVVGTIGGGLAAKAVNYAIKLAKAAADPKSWPEIAAGTFLAKQLPGAIKVAKAITPDVVKKTLPHVPEAVRDTAGAIGEGASTVGSALSRGLGVLAGAASEGASSVLPLFLLPQQASDLQRRAINKKLIQS